MGMVIPCQTASRVREAANGTLSHVGRSSCFAGRVGHRWLDPRPETVAGACFVAAGAIVIANIAEDILSGGLLTLDEPIVVAAVGALIFMGEEYLQSASAPAITE